MRDVQNISEKIGMPPGAPVYVGKEKLETTKITVFNFNEKKVDKHIATKLSQFTDHKKEEGITWINIEGFSDLALINEVGKFYGLHSLTIEDVLNTKHKVKYDVYNSYYFATLKIFVVKDGESRLEQVSLAVGRDFVFTFSQSPHELFKPALYRLKKNESNTRKFGADYLAYSLLDGVVDSYFPHLEELTCEVEKLTEQIKKKAGRKNIGKLHDLRKKNLVLKNIIYPIREIISGILRNEKSMIGGFASMFFKDTFDHVLDLIDMLETFDELLRNLQDWHTLQTNYSTKIWMKTVSILAAIFLPLIFIGLFLS